MFDDSRLEEVEGEDALESNNGSASENQIQQPGSKSRMPSKQTLLKLIPAVVLIIILLAGGGLLLANRKPADPVAPPAPVTINTQSLDNGTLNDITVQTGNINSPQQLTITPDTIFKNNIAVQDTLTVDQNLNVAGNTTLTGNTIVTGTSTLQGAVGINSNLTVRGALSVGGALSAASLNVGSLVTTAVNASGNINFGGHLVPSGASPTSRSSVAASGGTVTVSGNDTAGTLTITIGNGNLTAGEMAIISFNAPFAATPKVQLTPVNGGAASLDYFAARTTTFFTIETASLPAAGSTYIFDYLVTQ